MKIWKILEQNPPGAVRLMARRRIGKKTVRAISDEEIAITSGLPIDRVRAIYHLRSWDGVPIGELRAFCEGCNFDLFSWQDRNRRDSYVRTATWAYLRNSEWWPTIFQPLLLRLKENAA